ncbi:MAG TPA: alpha/beta hydrolase [candidate division Zixibacteria bacterium]|nr:alpha/beta hydrolase [candidate division Zixibacteria bacterium]
MPYEHRTVFVGDIKTHFLEAGSGQPLVLLHGGEYGASAEITWRANIDFLARRFRVIAPDMLGWGGTDKIYSFSDPAGFRIRHLKRLLETLGVEGAFFVGSSSGGGTILRAAVMEPPPFQILKMVTICGNASVFKTNFQADLENYVPSLENMRKIVALLYHDPKWQTPENVEERYQSSIVPGAWEALSAARLRSPVHQPRSTVEEFVRSLSRLRTPLLIMSCEHDPLNQPDWDVRFQEIVPGSKVHRFRNSAHEPQIEETEEFHRVLLDFLEG